MLKKSAKKYFSSDVLFSEDTYKRLYCQQKSVLMMNLVIHQRTHLGILHSGNNQATRHHISGSYRRFQWKIIGILSRPKNFLLSCKYFLYELVEERIFCQKYVSIEVCANFQLNCSQLQSGQGATVRYTEATHFFYIVGLNLNKNNINIRIICITIVLKCGQYCKLFPWEFRLLHWKDSFWIEVSNAFAGRLMFLQHLLLVFTGKHCCLFHWDISHWPLKVEIHRRTVSTDDFHSKSIIEQQA